MAYKDPKTGTLYPSKEYYEAQKKIGKGATTSAIKEEMAKVTSTPTTPTTPTTPPSEEEARRIAGLPPIPGKLEPAEGTAAELKLKQAKESPPESGTLHRPGETKPEITFSAQGKELPFPTNQAQMAEYQKGNTFTGGKWYEGKGTTPADTPTDTTTPTTPTTPTTDTKTEDTEDDFEKQTAKVNEEWEKKFKEMQTGFEKTQQEAEKKTGDILTKMGETATADTLAKFEETQKGIMEAYQSYFDQQSEYLKELQAQPSAVENLQKFREEQGLPQMEKELAGIDQTILDTEGLLANIEEDIRIRTEGLPVTEAAARRLTAMEQRPLTKQLTDLIRGRQGVAAGFEAKQATVDQFMAAQQAELLKQQEIAGARLGFAKEKAEVGADMQTQSFNLFTSLQDKMFKIDELRISAIENEADYKNKLTEMGFNFFSVMMAEQKADIKDKEAFQQQLIVEQLKADLKAQNPDVKFQEDFTDKDGNVTLITTYSDGSKEVVSLGAVGEREKPPTPPTPPMSYREWQLAGSPGTYENWLKEEGGKPPTSTQLEVAGYVDRISADITIFDELESQILQMDVITLAAQRKAPNMWKSPWFQEWEQAERDFLNAVLRRESGAAISPSEFEAADGKRSDLCFCLSFLSSFLDRLLNFL